MHVGRQIVLPGRRQRHARFLHHRPSTCLRIISIILSPHVRATSVWLFSSHPLSKSSPSKSKQQWHNHTSVTLLIHAAFTSYSTDLGDYNGASFRSSVYLHRDLNTGSDDRDWPRAIETLRRAEKTLEQEIDITLLLNNFSNQGLVKLLEMSKGRTVKPLYSEQSRDPSMKYTIRDWRKLFTVEGCSPKTKRVISPIIKYMEKMGPGKSVH